MKGNKKPHPYYSRRVVRREIARRLKAEAEVAQLMAQLESIHEMMLGIRQEFHRGMSSLKKVDEKLPVNMVK